MGESNNRRENGSDQGYFCLKQVTFETIKSERLLLQVLSSNTTRGSNRS